jgi:DNA polymerase III delta prime subunit
MSRIFDQSLHSRQSIATRIFDAAVERGRLAHAYLLTGRADDDKWTLSKEIACYLNCQSPEREKAGSCVIRFEGQELPPQACANCRWISQDQHPQAFLKLEGEGTKSGRIAVEKARALSDELAKTAQCVRVIVIPDATEGIFHRPAANALLKTIEEPGSQCLFLLFAPAQEEVLTTIVSRCQVVPILQLRESEQRHDIPAELAEHSQDLTNLSGATATLPGTIEWLHRLQDIAGTDIDTSKLIIDTIVNDEVDRLRDSASGDPTLSLYLRKLLTLAETAKNQVDHYVQAKHALEVFALSCRELVHGRLGEAGVD